MDSLSLFVYSIVFLSYRYLFLFLSLTRFLDLRVFSVCLSFYSVFICVDALKNCMILYGCLSLCRVVAVLWTVYPCLY